MGKVSKGTLFAVVASAGVVGALLRYGIGLLAVGLWDTRFPVGTLLINMSGSLFLGWFLTRMSRYDSIHPYLRTGIATGLIGSFTTFSTFSVETVGLIEDGLQREAMLYVVLSFWGGLLAVAAGSRLAKSRTVKGGRDA